MIQAWNRHKLTRATKWRLSAVSATFSKLCLSLGLKAYKIEIFVSCDRQQTHNERRRHQACHAFYFVQHCFKEGPFKINLSTFALNCDLFSRNCLNLPRWQSRRSGEDVAFLAGNLNKSIVSFRNAKHSVIAQK